MSSEARLASRGRNARRRDEDGFTMIEMVVAVSILAIALTPISRVFVDANTATNNARLREVAATVASSALDDARAVVPAATLMSEGTTVITPPAAVDLSGTLNAAALPPTQVTLDHHVFSAAVFVGNCYLQPNGQCTTTLTLAPMVRIVSDVTWSVPGHCTADVCSYVSSTLISTGSDPTLNVNPPGPPTNLAAQPGDQKVTLTWVAPPSASPITGYTVTSSPGGGTCTASGTGNSCTVLSLINGTPYSFTVTATSSGGTSSPSGSVIATPRYLVTWASAPALAPSVTSIGVSWAAPTSSSTITGYTATATAMTGPAATASCTTTGATSCTIGGLFPGTQYQVSVVAAAGSQTSNPSPAAIAVTTFVWAPPTVVSPSPGYGQLAVSWSAPTGTVPITGYTATASPGGASCTGTTSCTIRGLLDGATYSVTVTAALNGGNLTSPAAPGRPTYTVVWTSVPTATTGFLGFWLTAGWRAPTSTVPITGYVATATPVGGGTSGTCAAPAGATSCNINGLSGFTIYTVTVTAIGGGQTSNQSQASSGAAG